MKALAQKQFDLLCTECAENNLLGKRKRDSRLEVVEDAISVLGFNGDAAILMPFIVEELERRREAEKAKKPSAATKPAADTQVGYTQSQRDLLPVLDGDVFVITSAQNNTITTGFEDQLLALVDDMKSVDLDARLMVMPVYYNKNAFSPAVEREEEVFNPKILPYLQLEDCWLFEKNACLISSTAAVLPTNKIPVNAAAKLNSGELITVVASPKQQYKTLPRLNDQSVTKAVTTGSCTAYNYTRSRAGSEAEKDHKQAAMIVYKCDGGYNVTNVFQGDDGSLNVVLPELEYYYGKQPEAAKLGDLHCEVYDHAYWQKTVDFLDKIKPSVIAVDDILHFSTRSHHNRNSGKHLYANRHESVENDLKQVIVQLTELADLIDTVYITESNHNSALDNWLDDSSVNPKQDSHNSKLYYLLNWLVCDTLDQGEHEKNALQIALENADLTTLPELPSNVHFGRMDKPFKPLKFDYSQHGHKGANGSAGNPNQFKDWNLNLITGHTHSPCIIGSVFTTGVTARLNQGYNRGGASSWDHGHMMEYANGQVQLITLNPQKVIA